MGIEAGMLISGEVVPGTDWVERDPEGWWGANERGTLDRGDTPVTIILGHWTAGPCWMGDETARTVVRNQKKRKNRTTGRPLRVGFHFLIGWDGRVFQTCDLAQGAVHAGTNRHQMKASIGIETAWPGTFANATRLATKYPGLEPGEPLLRRVLGRKIEVMPPSVELLRSWVRLANTLQQHPGFAIAKRVPTSEGAVRKLRFSKEEQDTWCGAQEHFHVNGTGKSDACNVLLDALVADGWALG